jgi:hypothetical protein
MALKKNIDSQFGITINDAYIRVENISFDSAKTMRFFVRIYAKQNFPALSEQQMELAFDMDGENPYVQVYQYLKTLPEFTNAINC